MYALTQHLTDAAKGRAQPIIAVKGHSIVLTLVSARMCQNKCAVQRCHWWVLPWNTYPTHIPFRHCAMQSQALSVAARKTLVASVPMSNCAAVFAGCPQVCTRGSVCARAAACPVRRLASRARGWEIYPSASGPSCVSAKPANSPVQGMVDLAGHLGGLSNVQSGDSSVRALLEHAPLDLLSFSRARQASHPSSGWDGRLGGSCAKDKKEHSCLTPHTPRLSLQGCGLCL